MHKDKASTMDFSKYQLQFIKFDISNTPLIMEVFHETIKNFNFVFQQCVSHFCLFYSLSYKNKGRELFLFSRLHSEWYLLKSGKVNKCKLDFNYKIKSTVFFGIIMTWEITHAITATVFAIIPYHLEALSLIQSGIVYFRCKLNELLTRHKSRLGGHIIDPGEVAHFYE